MAKILLVEDDNNLREIYEARLQAEGYTIVSARDGEEALVVAKAEMPDLVISDVMMPKISGFEMLDILRDTETLRDVKVIMLTALGQAEDQTRADKLGADRYLVKSQVTLEDIVNVAGELLNVGSAAPEGPAAAAAAAPEPATAAVPEPAAAAQPTPTAQPVAEPVAATPQSVTPVEPAAAESVPAPVEPEVAPPAVSSQPTEATAAADVQAQIDSFAAAPASAPLTVDPVTAAQDKALQDAITDLGGSDDESAAAQPTPTAEPVADTPQPVTPVEPAAAAPAPASEAPVAASAPDEAKSEYVAGVSGKKIIAPLDHDQEDKKSLDQLLAEEEAKESGLGIPTASGSAPAPEGGTASNLPAVDPAILANTNANRPKDDEAEAAAILAQAKTAADPTAEVSPGIQPEAAQTPAAAPAEEDKPIDPSSVAL